MFSLSSESEKMLHSEESEEEGGNANGRGENYRVNIASTKLSPNRSFQNIFK
jgi:hypothetical protein